MSVRDETAPTVYDAQLSRDLTELDITLIGVGAMIGAGIFVLTGIAAGAAGPALMLSFALNGVVTIFTAMVYAELGSAIPEAGGGYLWVKDGLGRSHGFIAGWMSWFSHAVAGSLYCIGFGAYLALLLEEVGLVGELPVSHGIFEKGLGVLVALTFLWINFRGASETGLAGNLVTGGKLAVIGLFVVAGIAAIFGKPDPAAAFEPFFARGYGSVFIAMGLTFVAFEGYEIIVQAGEEVKDPRRSVPRAVFWSLIIVVPIYVLVAIVAVGAIETEAGRATWEFLGAQKELGMVEAARQFLPWGSLVMLVGGLLSTASALNATTFSSTRVAFAMGRDHVLPSWFARVHSGTRTPWVALVASGAIIIFMVVAVPIEDVAAAADVMFLLLFLQVNWAVIRIREKYGDELEYGYLMPFYPWVPLVGIATKTFLAVYLYAYSPTAWYAAGAWILVGLGVFFAFSRSRLEETEAPRVAWEEREWRPLREPVLVYLPGASGAEVLLRVATALARGGVAALSVVRVPGQLPLSQGMRFADEVRPVVESVQAFEEEHDADVRAKVTVSHRISDAVVQAAEGGEVETVVLGWRTGPRPRLIRGSAQEAILRRAPADVVVVKDRGLPRQLETVGVGLSPGVHGRRALEVAVDLALGFDVGLRVFTLLPSGQSAESLEEWFEEMCRHALEHGLPAERLTTEMRQVESIRDALIEEGGKTDILIVGASRDWIVKTRLMGSIPDFLMDRLGSTLVMVKEREAAAVSHWRRWIGGGA